jgi:hypothetical protein
VATDDVVSTDDVNVGDDLRVTGLATVGETLAVTGASTLAAVSATGRASFPKLALGAVEAVTIVSGVATVTGSYVRLIAESGTADQLDTITKTGVVDGDILVVVPRNTDTITVDDANIDLGAATRAIAPGGVMVLLYNAGAVGAASWQEVVFLAASDNA